MGRFLDCFVRPVSGLWFVCELWFTNGFCVSLPQTSRLFDATPMVLIFDLSLMLLLGVLSPMVLIFVLSRIVLIFNLSLMVSCIVQRWSMQIFVPRPLFLMFSRVRFW